MGKKIRQFKKLEASLQKERLPGTNAVLQAITKVTTSKDHNEVMDITYLSFSEEDSASPADDMPLPVPCEANNNNPLRKRQGSESLERQSASRAGEIAYKRPLVHLAMPISLRRLIM